MLTQPVWRAHVSRASVVGVFVVALLAGALTTAILLGIGSLVLSPVPDALAVCAVAAAVAVAVLRDIGVLRLDLPENRRLIPQDVFRNHPYASAGQFAFELGTGVRTYVPATAPYVAAIALLVLEPGLGVLAAGFGFGVGRSYTLLGRWRARDRMRWDESLDRLAPAYQTASTLLSGVACLGVFLLD